MNFLKIFSIIIKLSQVLLGSQQFGALAVSQLNDQGNPTLSNAGISIDNHVKEASLLYKSECVTRNGSLGICTLVGGCFGIYDSPISGDGIIIPRGLLKSQPTFQTNAGARLNEPFPEEITMCSSLGAYNGLSTTDIISQGDDGRMVCCPVDLIIALGNEAHRRLTPIPTASTNSDTPPHSLNKEIKSNIEPTCGTTKVILRLERILQVYGEPKITGGTLTTRGEFPWMVAIFGVSGKQTCGGSLINKNYVLTAAHCLASYTSKEVSELRVTIGDYNIQSTSDGVHQSRKISKILLHNQFSLSNFSHDIALMKLDRPVEYTEYIQPICLPNLLSTKNGTREDLALEGRKVIITGWGRDRSHGSASPILRKVEIPIWRHTECQRIYNIFAPGMKVSDSNMCAGDGKKNKDACVGDSGGPLIIRIYQKWYQLGIVSWGKGCGSFPGVYTRVDKYLPWIMKNIKL